jgi:hypothetical protein
VRPLWADSGRQRITKAVANNLLNWGFSDVELHENLTTELSFQVKVTSPANNLNRSIL